MYYAIHMLRGVAALLVAGFHLNAASNSEGFETTFFQVFKNGSIGVDIFFVISGFVIFLSASKSTQWAPLDFLQKRFFRIYPIYWMFLGVFLILCCGLWLATGDISKLPSIQVLIQSILLVPANEYAISIAWTLSVELTFYLIFCLTYRGANSSLQPVLLALTTWTALSVFRTILGHEGSFAFTLFHPAVPELFMGVLIAKLHLEGFRSWGKLATVLGSAGLIANLLFDHGHNYDEYRALLAGLPAALLIYGTLQIQKTLSRGERIFGDSSYVLYLAHIPAYLVFGFVLEKGAGFNIYSSELGMAFMLISVVFFSAICHLLIEKPYQNWYKQQLSGQIFIKSQ